MLPPYTKPHLSFADQLCASHAARFGRYRPGQGNRPSTADRLWTPGHPYWQALPADHPRSRRCDAHDPQRSIPGRRRVSPRGRPLPLRQATPSPLPRRDRTDRGRAAGRSRPCAWATRSWAHRSAAFLDPNRANAPFKGGTRHYNWLAKADAATDRDKDDWVKAFHATYSSPLPIWMAVEAWDFGSAVLAARNGPIPTTGFAIAKRYGLLPDTLVSWIKTLAFVRNISAHHARLWNTGIVNQPQVPKPYEAPRLVHIGSDVVRRSRVYGAAAVASYLVKRIHAGTSWSGRMKAHWLAFPVMPFATPAQGGFLAGWDQKAIWA